MTDGKLLLEIVVPERRLVSAEVDEVVAPGLEGYFGVLPGHTPFLSTLKAGELSYRVGGQREYVAISWGYAEVGPEKVTILAEAAETPEDIDLERADAARTRAEERLLERNGETDFRRARASLERALTRIQVAKRARS